MEVQHPRFTTQHKLAMYMPRDKQLQCAQSPPPPPFFLILGETLHSVYSNMPQLILLSSHKKKKFWVFALVHLRSPFTREFRYTSVITQSQAALLLCVLPCLAIMCAALPCYYVCCLALLLCVLPCYCVYVPSKKKRRCWTRIHDTAV